MKELPFKSALGHIQYCQCMSKDDPFDNEQYAALQPCILLKMCFTVHLKYSIISKRNQFVVLFKRREDLKCKAYDYIVDARLIPFYKGTDNRRLYSNLYVSMSFMSNLP